MARQLIVGNSSLASALHLSPFGDRASAAENGSESREASWADLCSGARIVWSPDGQPVRQIAPRSRLPVGRYNSRKAGRMLHHQSRGHGRVGGEKLALMICEVDPAVIDFRSQHIRFDLPLAGAMHAYFPDIVRLMEGGGISVVEVKKDNRWRDDPQYLAKIELAAEVCNGFGWDFDIWTDEQMAPTSRVRDNIAEIQMERFVTIDATQQLLTVRVLANGSGHARVRSIVEALGNPPGALSLVRGMMCRRVLSLPLDSCISGETVATAFLPRATYTLDHAS